jgi:hypothetical protein
LSTPCTGTPCFLDQIGTEVSSVTRSATGTYTFNFSRTYTKLKCIIKASSSGATSLGTAPNLLQCSSCSSLATVTTQVPSAGALADSIGVVICHGII